MTSIKRHRELDYIEVSLSGGYKNWWLLDNNGGLINMVQLPVDKRKNRINLPVEMRRLILKALEDGMLHRCKAEPYDAIVEKYAALHDVLSVNPMGPRTLPGKLSVYRVTRGGETKYIVPFYADYVWDNDDAMEFKHSGSAYRFVKETPFDGWCRPRALTKKDLEGGWDYNGPLEVYR
ncbi:MAG: hypothetical protein AB7U75_14490 [Hyphomicrobiaceae bacterium]